MFEEFRRQIDDSSFLDDWQHGKSQGDDIHQEKHFLGMTPAQRFITAVFILMMTLILGILLLLVTYKIIPPFTG